MCNRELIIRMDNIEDRWEDLRNIHNKCTKMANDNDFNA